MGKSENVLPVLNRKLRIAKAEPESDNPDNKSLFNIDWK